MLGKDVGVFLTSGILSQIVKALTDTKLKPEAYFEKMNVFLIKATNLHPIIIVTHILKLI